VGAGGNTEHPANVHDTFAIDSDVGFMPGGAERHGGGFPGACVGFDQSFEIEGGQDVTVVDEEGLVPDPGFEILESASGFEKNRFMKEREGGASIGSAGKCICPLFRQVVGVDGELLDSGGQTVVKSIFDEGALTTARGGGL
jgi:hypothetical protein